VLTKGKWASLFFFICTIGIVAMQEAQIELQIDKRQPMVQKNTIPREYEVQEISIRLITESS
jgi:hypothetical protein